MITRVVSEVGVFIISSEGFLDATANIKPMECKPPVALSVQLTEVV